LSRNDRSREGEVGAFMRVSWPVRFRLIPQLATTNDQGQTAQVPTEQINGYDCGSEMGRIRGVYGVD